MSFVCMPISTVFNFVLSKRVVGSIRLHGLGAINTQRSRPLEAIEIFYRDNLTLRGKYCDGNWMISGFTCPNWHFKCGQWGFLFFYMLIKITQVQ
ncbi:hypothetical protein MNBD_ALPHA11-1517 [hydrothermal vent metagenome]|uniref:Uncharacterized protein n=1 Tax=hydrothermal vent metagenome TaxID=652676 RepID=A0A3B0THJ7_9ZZZZ